MLFKVIQEVEGASLMAQQERICLQCRSHRRHRFDPRVWKIPLREEVAAHSSILAWRIIPWTE